MSRVQRRRMETRERIVAEAMRLFVEREFDSVTVAEIAEAADVGKGTFFTHFPTKGDVFRFVGEEVTAAVAAAAEASEGRPAPERLASALDAAAEWCEGHPQFLTQMVQARAFNLATDAGSPSQQRVVAVFAGIITAGVDTGELRDSASATAAAYVLLAGYFVSVLGWALDPSGPSLRERLRGMLDIVLNGLR